MESSKEYKNKITQLKKAVRGFEELMKADLFSLSELISDGVKNGQIQKFEYCAELLWKTVKVFLQDKYGTSSVSPKMVYRDLFKNGHIDEKTFEKLNNMVNHRNLLSHIYNEKHTDKIHKHLPSHLKLMKLVVKQMNIKI